VQDRRIIELNISQSFIGFLWGVLFSGVVRDVFGANECALTLLSLHWIKCGFAIAVAILLVGLVHSLWGWTSRVVVLEDFAREDTVPRREFLTGLRQVSTRTITVILSLAGALLITYLLFPTVVNGYVALFVATLWAVWVCSVVVVVIDRLGS